MAKYTVRFNAKNPKQKNAVQLTQTVEAESETVAIELAKKTIKHSPLHKDYIFSVTNIRKL